MKGEVEEGPNLLSDGTEVMTVQRVEVQHVEKILGTPGQPCDIAVVKNRDRLRW